jgi:Heat shock transcription factor
MKILDSEEFKDIFAWTKSGKSFSIYKPYELISKVLVVHFDGKCDMKFDSFLRKVCG